MNYSNSQRAGVILYLTASLFGGYEKNIETTEFRYFNKAELPELATEKNTKEQIEMCFNAYYNKNWIVEFD